MDNTFTVKKSRNLFFSFYYYIYFNFNIGVLKNYEESIRAN